MDAKGRREFKRYRKTVSLLIKTIPCALPVQVRRTRLKGYDGLCLREEHRFLILINRSLCEPMAIETLIHEYAHARSWTLLHDHAVGEEFENIVHGPAWGVAYAEAYRVYESSLPKRKKHPM